MDNRSLALIARALSELTAEDLDKAVAREGERAHRLAELIQSDVWKLDLYPIFRRLHDDYLQAVKAKTLDPDALKAFDDILNQIDGTIRVGAGSLERLAAKRAKAADIQTKINQRPDPNSALAEY